MSSIQSGTSLPIALKAPELKNVQRMAVAVWAVAEVKEALCEDLLKVVKGFLGPDPVKEVHLNEAQVRVMQWVNGKTSDWLSSAAVASLPSLSVSPQPSSSASSDNGLSASSSPSTPPSAPRSPPGIPTFVHRTKPRLDLRSLDRAPQARAPQARTSLMLR